MREELRVRMPDLANAPLLEVRVCQYEDTTDEPHVRCLRVAVDEQFLVGGSGHGFKLAPALGEHVAQLILGRRQPKAQFQLSSSSVTKRGTF